MIFSRVILRSGSENDDTTWFFFQENLGIYNNRVMNIIIKSILQLIFFLNLGRIS